MDWEQFVKIDKSLLRPAEVDLLVGDASRAREDLGWEPRVSFEEMIHMMVDADVERLKSRMSAEVPQAQQA